ncbi:MAG TPA: hypothetical protein VGL19_18550, partial [Polyangiaceae bacterium]
MRALTVFALTLGACASAGRATQPGATPTSPAAPGSAAALSSAAPAAATATTTTTSIPTPAMPLPPAPAACAATPREIGRIQDPELDEVSGVVESRKNP